MQVRFHREADEELAEAQNWYRERSEVAAQAFALEIDHAINSIAEAPLRWPQGKRGERRLHSIAFLTLFCIVYERITSSLRRSLTKAGVLGIGATANSAGQLFRSDARPSPADSGPLPRRGNISPSANLHLRNHDSPRHS